MAGTEQAYLAADLGASSGRLLVGLFDGTRLRLEEVHRFDNGPVNVAGSLHWDLLGLWSQVQTGLREAAARYGRQIRSVGVDTWGVDFGLLGRGDELLGNPYHYRDRRTDGILDRALAHVPRADIFAATGLQFMQFNTLYQLWAMRQANSPLLEAAERLLMMPDLFHWLLTGQKTNEFTNATTTQFFDPARRVWAAELLARFDLPAHILGDVIEPGTDLGPLLPHVAAETGLKNVNVVVPGTHDTASAVLAVPAEGQGAKRPDWAYVSSGTWALLGLELPAPVVDQRCLEFNFTNEGGVGGTIRLLKNITGLWLVQECRRVWAQQGRDYRWDELTRLAADTPSRSCFIDPDDASFLAPDNMPEAIQTYCRRTGQSVPDCEGAIIRCALESVALKSRRVLSWAATLADTKVQTLYVVGGGAKNRELCQATADACQVRVVAGPVEATATGNVLAQAIADGTLGSIAEARQVVRESFEVDEYLPRDADAWHEAYERFVELIDG